MNRRLRLVCVALLTLSSLAPVALCLCPPAPVPRAHGCCEHESGLVPGDRHCCQEPGRARAEGVLRGNADAPAVRVALPAGYRSIGLTLTSVGSPRPAPSPALVLRV